MTDSDCIVPNNWIEKITEPIIKEAESAVLGFENDLVKNYWSKNIQKKDWEFFKKNIRGKYINHIDTKNFAIKTSILKKLMFDASLENFDDLDLYLRLKENIKIRFVPSCKIWHRHKDSLFETIKLNFNRGFWTTRIWKKYKNSNKIEDEPMMESISVKNFITFPFWIICQLLTKPPAESFFILISEFSWRSGILWALYKK